MTFNCYLFWLTFANNEKNLCVIIRKGIPENEN